MSNEEKRPSILTLKEGEKTIKVCIEDIAKLFYKIQGSIIDADQFSFDLMHRYRDGKVMGVGRSKPCLTDAYDEEIGNNIAFMKAKLNANIKKHNALVRIYNAYINVLDSIDEGLSKIDDYIKMDLRGVRQYNPDYLSDLEEKLGI